MFGCVKIRVNGIKAGLSAELHVFAVTIVLRKSP